MSDMVLPTGETIQSEEHSDAGVTRLTMPASSNKSRLLRDKNSGEGFILVRMGLTAGRLVVDANILAAGSPLWLPWTHNGSGSYDPGPGVGFGGCTRHHTASAWRREPGPARAGGGQSLLTVANRLVVERMSTAATPPAGRHQWGQVTLLALPPERTSGSSRHRLCGVVQCIRCGPLHEQRRPRRAALEPLHACVETPGTNGYPSLPRRVHGGKRSHCCQTAAASGDSGDGQAYLGVLIQLIEALFAHLTARRLEFVGLAGDTVAVPVVSIAAHAPREQLADSPKPWVLCRLRRRNGGSQCAASMLPHHH